MEEQVNCPKCDDPMDKATLPGGGFIGWFCYECEGFKPLDTVTIL